MSKLDKLTFYSKLQDLFDSIPPNEIPSRIENAIQFTAQNMEWYIEEHGHNIQEIREGMEALTAIKGAFEDSMINMESWSFYLCHGDNQYQVNLRPFYNFLHDNGDFVEKINALSESWHVLINYENIQDFQDVQTIVSNLKYTFGKSIYSSW